MDATSITVKSEQSSVRVDTPMRSVNAGSHKRVFRLYKELGITLKRADFSYSFATLRKPKRRRRKVQVRARYRRLPLRKPPLSAGGGPLGRPRNRRRGAAHRFGDYIDGPLRVFR